jgi:cytochrome c oxidase assembly protein subunit 11
MIEAKQDVVDTRTLQQRHRRVATWTSAGALLMLGLAFASVPLYRLFCQVTGFGGTTQRAIAPSTTTIDRHVTVRFDANVSNGLRWSFEPVVRTVDLQLGENRVVAYRATNVSDKPLTGTASFNVTPDAAGAYFNKIECFCFTEQTLKPGESIEMPVSFYVDPEFANERATRGISQITLSYTFFPVEPAGTGVAPGGS